ncbi:DUF6087 family protein [Streptomyces sp. H27-H5]|uniref:DUF6087 family protein n=1 Tax=Streptomyces sp. H27-H5 TaxID=2996460 RepID=UPI002271FBB7|nr:DUF6087 family protein [Streptomyces sp. H27-H5]MCY0961492.1 DUF6087 family protein [Streptomyces sp. H27-H5]
MDEEPLEEWAARRDARRRPVGDRKAVPLDDGPPRGAHRDPDAPRGVLEWDGQQWTPAAVADGYAAAARAVDPTAAAAAVPLHELGTLPTAPEPWRPTREFRRP